MATRRKQVQVNTTVADAVSTAFGVVTELAEEMREAYDNTPESLQGSGVGEARGEAADALEYIEEPQIPEALAHIPVSFCALPLSNRASRADRMSDGMRYAQEAIDVLQGIIDEHLKEESDTFGELTAIEIEEVMEQIQGMVDDADGVSFPGMYG